MTISTCFAVLHLILLVATVVALPAPEKIAALSIFGCDAPVELNSSTNIWKQYTLHPNKLYRDIVTVAIENITDSGDKEKALRIANTGNFAWIETRDEIHKIDELVQDVPCQNILGLVIAGLPYKTCLSFGFPPAEDPWNYVEEFLKPIVLKIKSRPNTAFAIILEPGALPNYALNPGTMCKHVRESWYRNVPKALKALDLPNVIMYLDGGHGGVFGWTGNHWQGSVVTAPNWFHMYEGTPMQGATELTETWRAAGTLTQFRGLAVNVRNYNSWDAAPGENFKGENSCYDIYNKARNEKRYLEYLRVQGFAKINSTMPFHNIIDTTRNGMGGVRENWSDWCNVRPVRNGPKPAAAINEPNLDAFVWANGLGLSDGTSDPNRVTYRADCGSNVSFKPMPERGEFSLAYFQMMMQECGWCAKNRDAPRVQARCG